VTTARPGSGSGSGAGSAGLAGDAELAAQGAVAASPVGDAGLTAQRPLAAGPAGAAFVVLRRDPEGRWVVLGEVARRRGLTARAARAAAIEEASGDAARPGDAYAAVLRSEWRIAQEW